MKWLKFIWILTLISAFLGTLLTIDSLPYLFAYRILLIVHLYVFIVFATWRPQDMISVFKLREYMIFITIWFAWAIISLLWAPSKAYAFKHLYYLFSGFSLIIFTIYYFRTEASLKMLFRINCGVLAFLMILGLWELRTGLHISGGFPHYYLKPISLPFIGVFGHPNNFATYLSMYLPLFYVCGKYQKNILVKICSMAGIFAGFHLIIMAGSRANMMAMVLGGVVILILNIIESCGKGSKQVVTFLTVIFLVVMIGYSITPVAQVMQVESETFKNQVTSVFKNWNQDWSINIRKLLIQKGLIMLKKYHWLGVGGGNSEYLMQQHMKETYGHLKLHNWWLEVLVNYGLIIWILYLLFYFNMLKDLFVVFRRASNPMLKMFAEALIVSLFTFAVGVISNGSMTASRHMWILYGLVLCTINIFRENEKSKRKGRKAL